MNKLPPDVAENIVDPTFYRSDRASDALFKKLRQHSPVTLAEHPDYNPFWVITRMADAKQILSQPTMFRSGIRPATLMKRNQIEIMELAKANNPQPIHLLTELDGEKHRELRNVLKRWLSPSNQRRLEGTMRKHARRVIERMRHGADKINFHTSISDPYALINLMNLLGIESQHAPLLRTLTQDIFGAGSDIQSQAGAQTTHTLEEILKYLIGTVRSFRDTPDDDCLISHIANASCHGSPLSELEAAGYIIIIASAAHDSIAGCLNAAMWAVAKNPTLFKALSRNRQLAPNLVDEAIRWATPVQHAMRTAASTVDVGTQTIHEGDWVYISYLSCNRDETAISEPHMFDISRPNCRHLGFGWGTHNCLGQAIARLEMLVFIEQYFELGYPIELDGNAEKTGGAFLNIIHKLPVRLQF